MRSTDEAPERTPTAAAATGLRGEQAAMEYLRAEGYVICARNWRQGRYELDIVACKGGILHIVEVKTRRAGSLTPPEAAITRRKFQALHRATSSYLAATGTDAEVQYDLAAVEVAPDGTTRVELIEQAMEYNW